MLSEFKFISQVCRLLSILAEEAAKLFARRCVCTESLEGFRVAVTELARGFSFTTSVCLKKINLILHFAKFKKSEKILSVKSCTFKQKITLLQKRRVKYCMG